MSTQTITSAPEWDLRDRLAKSLRVSGVTPNQMADALGVHVNTVRSYLRGRTPPDRRTVTAWSVATGVPRDWLEGGGPTRALPVGYRWGRNSARYLTVARAVAA